MNLELIKNLLPASDLQKVEKGFDRLPEAEQLKIFMKAKEEIADQVLGAYRQIEDHQDEIRYLEDDIHELQKLALPISEEIKRARIRLGLDPVPGQLPLFEVAS